MKWNILSNLSGRRPETPISEHADWEERCELLELRIYIRHCWSLPHPCPWEKTWQSSPRAPARVCAV